MLPSSGEQDQPKSSQLRRYGPLAIVVVIAVVIGIVVLVSGGSDDKKTATGSSGSSASSGASTSSTGESSTGAISYSAAKAAGRTDLTFNHCDTEIGRIAMPNHYAPECYADLPATASTAQGVTNDTIKVVVYQSQENDPVLAYINAAIKNTDTNAQVADTYKGYTDMFQTMYE